MNKLLILVDWYRPAYKAGGPIKSIYHICELLENEVDIRIITGDRDLGDEHPFTGVRLNKWTIKAKAKVLYLKRSLGSIIDLFRGIKYAQADAIYVNGLFSWFFNLLPLFIFFTSNFTSKLIIAPRGMLHEGALQLKSNKKKVYLKILKILLPKPTIFHATDQQEAEDIQRELGITKDRIVVLGNLPGKVADHPGSTEFKKPIKLVLVSRLTQKKNILGLLEELKSVREEVVLDIYGAFQAKKYEERCHSLVQELPDNINVQFKGEIHPAHVKERLLQYHFYILLTHGENFGHSIFEAMSVGVPIIISDTTPWSYVCQKGGGRLWRQKGDLNTILSELALLSKGEYCNMQSTVLDEAKIYASAQNFENEYKKLFYNK